MPLNAPQQALATDYLTLAYHLAWRFARRHARDVPADELVSESMFALVRAASAFDPARDVPFGAYATLCIKRQVIGFINAWRRRNRFELLTEAGDAIVRGTPNRGRRDISDEVGDREACAQIRSRLPAKWWGMLSDYYTEGDHQDDLAAKHGMSRQRAGQIVHKALQRARKVLCPELSEGGCSA
jgi:RNA polymerase sigma factor (sigma-70 family)